jgi:hypothetical protein
MIDISYDQFMERVKIGAFLTVEDQSELNTMTIGWFEIGYFWRREVMTVGVRPTRHTHHIIENVSTFSVTVPEAGTFKNELTLCGSKSGRDIDKFDVCNLPLSYHGEEKTPYILIPGEHLFGKIITKTVMDPALSNPGLESLYPNKDYHSLYFAEIIDFLRIGS